MRTHLAAALLVLSACATSPGLRGATRAEAGEAAPVPLRERSSPPGVRLASLGTLPVLRESAQQWLAWDSPGGCTGDCRMRTLTLSGALTGATASLTSLALSGALSGVTTGAFSGTITSSQASGSNAVAFSTNGARLDLGTASSDYLDSNGSYIHTPGSFHTEGTLFSGSITNGSTLLTGDYIANSGSGANCTGHNSKVCVRDADGFAVADGSGTVTLSVVGSSGLLTTAAGVVHTRATLPTCAAGLEGAVYADVASGASTGARTKLCLCTSDGAGSPAYAWQNLATAAVGTTTTCG